MSIDLSIRLPLKKGETKNRLVDMSFKKSDKAAEVASNIVDLNSLDTSLRYSLFLERTCSLISASDTLAAADVKDGDVVEIKLAKHCGPLNVACASSGHAVNFSKDTKQISVDFSDPLRKYIPLLVKLFNLGKAKEEFCVRKLKKNEKDDKIEALQFLNVNISLKDLNINQGGSILLIPISLFEEKTIEQLFSTDDSNKVKGGYMSKWSQKGTAKATGVKKRWCVMYESFLMYFEDNRGSTKPSGVVDLEHFNIERDSNTSIRLVAADNTFSGAKVTYGFACDTELDMKDWVAEIRHHVANGDHYWVFGKSLEKLFKARKNILSVIVKSLNYLDAKGLDTPQVFVAGGDKDTLQQIRESFDQGKDVDLNKVDDPCVVASLLKQFFRELPKPLLTFHLYPKFLAASTDVTELNELISELPIAHQVVLETMLYFFARVLNHSSRNGMEMEAVTTVFGPIFLRTKNPNQENLVKDLPGVKQTLKTLIENRASLTFARPSNEGKREWKIEIKNQMYATAMYNYTASGKPNARGELDISFSKGDVMQILEERPNSQWIKAKLKDKNVEGYVPANYIKKGAIDVTGDIKISNRISSGKSRSSSKPKKPSRSNSKSKDVSALPNAEPPKPERKPPQEIPVQPPSPAPAPKVQAPPKLMTDAEKIEHLEKELAKANAIIAQYEKAYGKLKPTKSAAPPAPGEGEIPAPPGEGELPPPPGDGDLPPPPGM